MNQTKTLPVSSTQNEPLFYLVCHMRSVTNMQRIHFNCQSSWNCESVKLWINKSTAPASTQYIFKYFIHRRMVCLLRIVLAKKSTDLKNAIVERNLVFKPEIKIFQPPKMHRLHQIFNTSVKCVNVACIFQACGHKQLDNKQMPSNHSNQAKPVYAFQVLMIHSFN